MEISKENWEELVRDVDGVKKELTLVKNELRNLKLVVHGDSDLGIIGLQAIVREMNTKLDNVKISLDSMQDNRKFVITLVGLLISMIGSVGAMAGVIFMLVQNAQKVITP